MHDRDLARCAAVITIASFTGLLAAQATAQTTTPDDWTPPRMADGRPDLQGVWLSNTATPLQRPSAFAGRARLTDEDVATLRARAEQIFRHGRSAFTTPEGAFFAALNDVGTYDGSQQSTSSSIGMVDLEFTDRTSLVVDPPDGRIPRLTPAAREREATVGRGWDVKTGPEDFNSFHRCITTGVPRLGGNFGTGPYTFYQMVQTPDHVAFISEAFHDVRIIPLDDRPRLPDRVRQWNGAPRGHWEGDTLVVETTNFSSNSYFRGAAEGLHLIERFTRSGPDTLTYEMTFTDPTTWASPWTAQIPLKRRDQAIYEFACHEGNRSMVGMLRTARLKENAANDGGRRTPGRRDRSRPCPDGSSDGTTRVEPHHRLLYSGTLEGSWGPNAAEIVGRHRHASTCDRGSARASRGTCAGRRTRSGEPAGRIAG